MSHFRDPCCVCPICGVTVKARLDLIAYPGSGSGQHRCNPKKLVAIDRALKQETIQPMLDHPNRNTRLSHGFLLSGMSGDDTDD